MKFALVALLTACTPSPDRLADAVHARVAFVEALRAAPVIDGSDYDAILEALRRR